MKKIVLFLLIVIPFLSFSQEHRFSIGVTASPTLTSTRGTSSFVKYEESKMAFSFGATFNYKIHRNFSLQADLSFERKGSVQHIEESKSQGYYEGTSFKVNNNFDYLTLPLLARATFGNKVNFFVNAGPFVGFLLRQEEVRTAEGFPTDRINYTDVYKRFDAGITIGAGVLIPIKERFSISFEGRNNLGLVDIEKPSSTLKTNSVNLLFGLVYHL